MNNSMKTKEEVKKHLLENGYAHDAICRIMGFLIGVGLKEYDEEFKYLKGDGCFEKFYAWWNNKEIVEISEEEYEGLVYEILNEFQKKYNEAKDASKEKLDYAKKYTILLDAFIEEDEE